MTTLSVAGATTMPVKIGMKSHTRLTKNDTESCDAAASASVAPYMPEQNRDVPNERGDDEQAEQR